jgi:hypothetical protein
MDEDSGELEVEVMQPCSSKKTLDSYITPISRFWR